jgi:hypothetical protein
MRETTTKSERRVSEIADVFEVEVYRSLDSSEHKLSHDVLPEDLRLVPQPQVRRIHF